MGNVCCGILPSAEEYRVDWMAKEASIEVCEERLEKRYRSLEKKVEEMESYVSKNPEEMDVKKITEIYADIQSGLDEMEKGIKYIKKEIEKSYEYVMGVKVCMIKKSLREKIREIEENYQKLKNNFGKVSEEYFGKMKEFQGNYRRLSKG